MAKNNPVIGTMDCPVCRDVFERQTTVQIQLQKEGAGMASFICDGRGDPDKPSCGSNLRMGSAATIKIKAVFAKAERTEPVTDQQTEGEDNGAAPERTGSGSEETGSGNDFLD